MFSLLTCFLLLGVTFECYESGRLDIKICSRIVKGIELFSRGGGGGGFSTKFRRKMIPLARLISKSKVP